MRPVLRAAVIAAFALPLLTASSATADERRCYTPHIGSFDTFEVCHYLPVDPELGS